MAPHATPESGRVLVESVDPLGAFGLLAGGSYG